MMSSYTDDDLISLVDPGEAVFADPVSPTTTASISSNMAANRRKPTQRDSFSGLAGLMKAKKPYTPIPLSSPRSSLSVSTNGMQFASRVASGSSILSPLARPYHADGSVAAYLQDQARSPTTAVTPCASEYRQQDMQRLESMLQELEDLPIDDDDDDGNATVQHVQPQAAIEALLPGFELPAALPIRTGPITPPTPAASAKPLVAEEPVVRVTMHVWDAMGRDLEALKDKKRALEVQVAGLEKQKSSTPPAEEYNELQTQIGKLQYQNETNKVQKATMARMLSEKDIQIKQLQLDWDSANESLQVAESAAKDYADVVAQRNYLQTTLKNDRIGNSRILSDLTDVKDREIVALTRKVDELQEALRRSKDAVTANSDEYKILAQNRLDQLNQNGKLLRTTQEKYAAEHTKVGELEDCIEDLRRKLNQVGDLQGQLREKTSACDRFRTKLKAQEKGIEDLKQRLVRVSNEGQALHGAAHLVKPAHDTKLSSLVLGCSECYAKNISCDNKTRCRHCTENNENCVRWRCSLKHRLGQCPKVPCTFPHEADGWLLAPEPRPEW